MIFFIYLSTILGFTFVFILLMPNVFKVHGQTLMKTVAMMVGELEYEDTFGDESFTINLVFFVFVIIIPIIINNLLIGLTVDNVSELMDDALFKSLESKIKTISQIEKSFTLKKVKHLFSNTWFHFYLSRSIIFSTMRSKTLWSSASSQLTGPEAWPLRWSSPQCMRS